MKLIATVIIYFFLISISIAQLDASRAQVKSRYGSPRVTKDITLIERYLKDARIEVRFSGGTVDAITYQMREGRTDFVSEPVQMTLVQLTGFLLHNIKAGAWKKTGERTWVHEKEKKSAFYSDDEHRLYVWRNQENTDELWDRHIEMSEEYGLIFNDDDLVRYRRIQSVVCE